MFFALKLSVHYVLFSWFDALDNVQSMVDLFPPGWTAPSHENSQAVSQKGGQTRLGHNNFHAIGLLARCVSINNFSRALAQMAPLGTSQFWGPKSKKIHSLYRAKLAIFL